MSRMRFLTACLIYLFFLQAVTSYGQETTPDTVEVATESEMQGPKQAPLQGPTPQEQERLLDEILLKNGSRILGTVISAREGTIKIDTDFGGVITIDSSSIDSLHTRSSFVVLMADGTTIKDQSMLIEESGIFVTTETGDELVYSPTDARILNPEPWEMGDGYKFSGLASTALMVERGNSNTDELDYKVETTWRSLRDRYSLKLFGELDEANGVKNSNNRRVVGKYDYFLGDVNYWGVKLAMKQDEFADLDLRAYLGPYYGRQFYERRIFTLSGELGVSYVIEDFIVAEDQQYPGMHWEVDLTTDYLGGDSKIYINQGGIWNLKDKEDIILALTVGLSFPLWQSLEIAAEVFLEYDSGAVEGIEELDQTYKFRIGYTW